MIHPDIDPIIFSFCDLTTKIILAKVYNFQIQERINNIIFYAVQDGHLDVIKYYKNQGHKLNGRNNSTVSKWAKTNKFNKSVFVCVNAAKYGHLDIIIWAKNQGCNWNSLVASQAVINGHLNVIKYYLEQGGRYSNDIMINAVKHTQLHVLDWLKVKGYELKNIYNNACYLNNLTLLAWCFNNLEPPQDLDIILICYHRKDMLKLAFELNILSTDDSSICARVASWDNLDLLIIAREVGFDWDLEVCRLGHRYPDIDQYLRNHDCPCSKLII